MLPPHFYLLDETKYRSRKTITEEQTITEKQKQGADY
jgi:hypothetical protein